MRTVVPRCPAPRAESSESTMMSSMSVAMNSPIACRTEDRITRPPRVAASAFACGRGIAEGKGADTRAPSVRAEASTTLSGARQRATQGMTTWLRVRHNEPRRSTTRSSSPSPGRATTSPCAWTRRSLTYRVCLVVARLRGHPSRGQARCGLTHNSACPRLIETFTGKRLYCQQEGGNPPESPSKEARQWRRSSR